MYLSTPPPSLAADQARKGRNNTPAFKFESLTASPPHSRKNSGQASPSLKVEKRRGHHHKHSLSHQFFLPPVERAPLSLPASFPIPTRREIVRSCNTTQKIQLFWACLHLFLGFIVFKLNSASLAVASISKCISFDAYGLASITIFEVMDNFPAWRGSSLKHPFGLKRAEVVVRFGAAVFLTYSGIELVREVVEHIVIGGGHGHGSTEGVHLDAHSLNSDYLSISMVVTILVTLFAAFAFRNHAELSQALMLVETPRSFYNPFYYLTILPALFLFVLGSSGKHLHAATDHTISACIALSFLILGITLIYRLGSILLMTLPSASIDELFNEVEGDDSVTDVHGEIWQVWSGLVIVSLKVGVKGGENTEIRLRERIVRYVKDILGGGYGSGNRMKFSVHVECERIR